MDPNKIDFSFMKTGSSLLQSTSITDTDKIEIGAILITFMEEAIRTASKYTEHSKRKIVTTKDIQRALKVEVFQFTKKQDLSEKIEKNQKIISEDFYGISSDSEDIEDDLFVDKIDEKYKNSICSCKTCSLMNFVETFWKDWKPTNNLEDILKRNIDKMN